VSTEEQIFVYIENM